MTLASKRIHIILAETSFPFNIPPSVSAVKQFIKSKLMQVDTFFNKYCLEHCKQPHLSSEKYYKLDLPLLVNRQKIINTSRLTSPREATS